MEIKLFTYIKYISLLIKRYIFLFALFLCANYSYSAENDEKNVLVIHSYHQGLEWTDSISAGINSVFKQQQNINLYYEYLDTKRNNSENYFESMVKLYQSRTSIIKYNAIIACDNAAYDFMLKFRDEFFPNVPVFFCGVNFIDSQELFNSEEFYGFQEIADHMKTINTAKQLFPERDKMLIINDYTLTGRKIRQELEPVLIELKDKFSYEIIDTFCIEELTNKVQELSDEYIIYLLVINADRLGNFISYRNGINIIRDNTKVPIVGSWDFYLGKGIVGGSITKGFEQGKKVAELALKRINDSNATIRILQNGPTTMCFDFRMLEKFKLSEKDLPIDSLLINKSKLSDRKIKLLLNTFYFLIGVIVLLIARLFVRKASEKKLNKLVSIRTNEINEVNKQLEAIGKSKDDLLRVVSHDLRNPISNIKGFAEVLLNDDNKDNIFDKDTRECMDWIHELSVYMSSLVNNLLDISVLELGETNMTFETIEYISFIKNEILLNEALSKEFEITLELQTDIEEVLINIDKFRIEQALKNLISNAFKFSKPQSAVSILVEREGNTLITIVRDEGLGIPKEKQELIFEKFAQINPNSTKCKKGAGLGLSIVKGIIEAHKGVVLVESRIGKGTDFIFSLPIDG